MKTNNPILDNMIDLQSKTINNWVETTQKFQKAFTGGSIALDGQNIYKEWHEKQSDLMNGLTSGSVVNNVATPNFTANKPEEFFKNWYTQQMDAIKKMTDFNQSIYNSFANFGKSSNDYVNNFTNMNSTWTGIYNNWMNTLNSSYETLMKTMPNTFNQDTFKNMFETNKMYLKLQEFYQPLYKSFQSGTFTPENLTSYYNLETYKNLTEQMFGSYYNNANLKEVFDSSIKNIHSFFTSNNNLSKEYYEQIQSISNNFPNLISGDFAKLSSLYNDVNNVFGKTFEPLMKLVTPGKEKETVEANIQLLDKIAEYSVRQSELQYHFYTTTQKAFETTAKNAYEKFTNTPNATETLTFNDFYNEWLKTNETLYTDLFSSDEFSKIKGDVLSLGMDVKKHFEKQFENVFNIYPVVFRSEVDELVKTIHDLKKQVKNLEVRLAATGAASVELEDEDKTLRKRK